MATRSAERRNVQSLIEEMEQKIQLSEGDKKAFSKKSDVKIKENRETILRLREELKKKRKDIANEKSASEILKAEEFKKFPEERKYLVNKPPDAILEAMDERTIDLMNVLNMARFETKRKQLELEDVRTQAKNCGHNAGAVLADDSRLRELENRVDKTNAMCKEAEHIRHTYHQIRSKLEDEQTTFGTVLDEAEAEIKRLRTQLGEVKLMQSDVRKGMEAVMAELERKEREYQVKKKKREAEVEKSRKEADDLRREVADIRNGQQKDQQSATGEAPEPNALTDTGDFGRLREFEEHFSIIKAAVGVSDTKEVVKRFESQKERQTQLNEMREKNEARINELTEEKNSKVLEFQRLQFSVDNESTEIDAKLKSDLQSELQVCKKNMEIAKSKLESQSKLLTNIKTGVEHLMEKTKNINIPPEAFVLNPDEDSREAILAQLNFCEEKLAALYNEDKLIDSVMNEIKPFPVRGYEDLSRRYEGIAPSRAEAKFGADYSSDDNEEQASRNFLKRQSQEIIENRIKKKHSIKQKKKLN